MVVFICIATFENSSCIGRGYIVVGYLQFLCHVSPFSPHKLDVLRELKVMGYGCCATTNLFQLYRNRKYF